MLKKQIFWYTKIGFFSLNSTFGFRTVCLFSALTNSSVLEAIYLVRVYYGISEFFFILPVCLNSWCYVLASLLSNDLGESKITVVRSRELDSVGTLYQLWRWTREYGSESCPQTQRIWVVR